MSAFRFGSSLDRDLYRCSLEESRSDPFWVSFVRGFGAKATIMSHPLANDESCVFYVTSHGSAGDHWFDWFARSLNASPDLMIYMGESVRTKYLRERKRHERPDPVAFTQFLIDLGRPYPAIGECYAYRAYQLEPVREVFGDTVRFVNIVRHPYCWLSAYVNWRTTNMGMPPTLTSAIEHEWSVTRHEEFLQLGLRPYERQDIDVWASHQGMHILNRMISDTKPGVKNVCLETLVQSPEIFNATVNELTHGRVLFDKPLLERVYAWTGTPFRSNGWVISSAEKERQSWPDWKAEAFEKLVSPAVQAMFQSFGYRL